jgi:azurin
VPYSEGEWTPTSAIAQVIPGGYYGYPGPKKDVKTQPPLLWLPRGVDNSAGGQVWVPDDRWGPLKGQMIHLSYGTGNAFLVLRQEVNGVWQGAAVPLPGDFNSGAHRGRFSPQDGQLYVSGMTGWGTYTPDDGCLHRVRYTGGPMHIPIAFEARDNGILLTFSDKLDAVAAKVSRHFAQCWNYRYSAAYGSPELSLRHPDKPGHDVLQITSAHLLGDGWQLFLEIPQLQPAGQLHVVVAPQPGLEREVFLTIHQLGTPFTDFPGYQVVAKTLWQANGTKSDATQPSPFEKGAAGRAIRLETAAALQFATKEILVRTGERISLTLANPDVLPHNWVLVAPGALEQVGNLSNKLIADPEGFARHYVPAVPEVLAWTVMINPQGSTTIHFNAPEKPGDYPYICTFPGHWMVMKGVLQVRD